MFVIPLICIILFGCTQNKILERISLVTLIGYDVEDDKLETTTNIREINPEFESTVQTQSDTASTSKGTRVKINMKSSKKLMAGQLRVVLFGEDLAKKGIDEISQTLMMNSEFSTSIYLGVVEGKAKSMLETKYDTITDFGQHVFNLLSHNIQQQQSISSTLHEVVRDLNSPYQSVALPIIKKDGQIIKINGIAFFKNAKMVGNLPADDIYYIMMIRDNIKNGILELPLEDVSISDSNENSQNLKVAIDSIISQRSIKVTNPESLEFDLTIDIHCRLVEIHPSVPFGNQQVLEKLEKALNKKINEEISRIIKYSQEINSDIFGFGEHFKSQVRNVDLTKDKWSEMYPNINVNTKTHIKIIRDGLYE